jgi:O-antigen ligase
MMERIRDSSAEVRERLLPHRMPIYKLLVILFLLSMLIDTGSDDSKGPLGLTVTLVTMICIAAVGLFLWKPPRDSVLWACVITIGTLVWLHVLSGQTLRAATIIMSVIVFSLVVGGVRASVALFWYQIRAAIIGPLFAGFAFYLGFWHTEWTGRQSFLGFQVNGLAFFLALGFMIGLSLVFQVKKSFRVPMLLVTVLLLPPIWATGTRSGLALTVVLSALFLGIRSGRRWAAVLCVGVVFVAGSLTLYLSDTILPDSLADSVTVRRFSPEQLAAGEANRVALILAGLDAFLQRPWTGHGIDAPLSLQWRADHLEYTNPDDTGLGTHNGFVDFLIIGGVPFCALYMMLFLRIGGRLWRATGKARGYTKDVIALSFCLYLLFIAEILLGDTFGKLGWWSFGIALQALSLHAVGIEERATSTVDAVK